MRFFATSALVLALSSTLAAAQSTTAFRGTAVGDKVPVTFSNPSVNVDDTRNPPANPQVAPAVVVTPVVAPQAPPVVQKEQLVEGDKAPVTFSNPSVNVDDTRNPSPTTPQVAPAPVTPVVAPQAPPVVQKEQVVEGDKAPVTFSNPSVSVDEIKNRQQVVAEEPKDVNKEQFSG